MLKRYTIRLCVFIFLVCSAFTIFEKIDISHSSAYVANEHVTFYSVLLTEDKTINQDILQIASTKNKSSIDKFLNDAKSEITKEYKISSVQLMDLSDFLNSLGYQVDYLNVPVYKIDEYDFILPEDMNQLAKNK